MQRLPTVHSPGKVPPAAATSAPARSMEPVPSPAPEPLIRLANLSKRYGRIHALREVTVDVPPGPVGLLGPNGAGKTTLIKLLLGLLEPTDGSASIARFDPRHAGERVELRRAIGYMPEGDCLIPGMNAVELVSVLGQLAGLSQRDAMTRAHEMLDYVGLDEERYRRSEEFSTGMKQRLKLAQALVHDPRILLLDEPTNGLDPKGRKHMLELIHDLGHAQAKNVLLCSHLLPDVEKTCTEVVVLQEGRVRMTGNIARLTAAQGSDVTVELVDHAERLAAALAERGVRNEVTGVRRLLVQLDAGQTCDALFDLARGTDTTITSIEPVRSTLEEVFLSTLSKKEAD